MLKFRGLFALLSLLLAPIAASGQTNRTTSNLSTTIAVTNTFQSIEAANPSRNGCSVQNTGTNAMYVFFGPIASATIAKSVKLTAGQSVTCNFIGVVLMDQVSITGTSTETFYAGFQ